MKIYLPKIELRSLPEILFLIFLLGFPFFGFVIYKMTKMEPLFALGLICMLFIVYRLAMIWKNGEKLILPNYLIVYVCFMFYAVILNLTADSETFLEEGFFKLLYSNSILLTFYAFFIIENTKFPSFVLNQGIKVLAVILVAAAVVSMVQYKDPFFFTKKITVDGLSFEQLQEYYANNGYESTASIRRFLTGYRHSIFSFINQLSVGIDSLALFSLLVAWKSKSKWKYLFIILAALISFLSSSRWIMLNFIVVASQGILLWKNKLLGAFKYLFLVISVVLVLFGLLSVTGFDINGFIENRLLASSASTRFLAFEVFTKVFPDNPIIGTRGTDTEKMIELLGGHSSQIHVGYLKLFYYYGLCGGILYLTFLGMLLVRLWKRAKFSKFWGGFFAVLAFAVANFTLFEISFFYYGIVLAMIYANYFYNQTVVTNYSEVKYYNDDPQIELSASKFKPRHTI